MTIKTSRTLFIVAALAFAAAAGPVSLQAQESDPQAAASQAPAFLAGFAGIDRGGAFSVGTTFGLHMPHIKVAGYPLTVSGSAAAYPEAPGTSLAFDADGQIAIGSGANEIYLGAGARISHASSGDFSSTNLGISTFAGAFWGSADARFRPYGEVRLVFAEGGTGAVVRGGVRIPLKG